MIRGNTYMKGRLTIHIRLHDFVQKITDAQVFGFRENLALNWQAYKLSIFEAKKSLKQFL